MHSFKVFKAIDFGFRMFARNIWLMLGFLFLVIGVEFGTDVVREIIMQKSGISTCYESHQENGSGEVKKENASSEELSGIYSETISCYKKNPLAFILQFLIFLLAKIFMIISFVGWNRIALDLYDTGTSKLRRIFAVVPLLFTYIIGGSLYFFVVSVGLLLLIIPGIIWGLKYCLFDLIIIDTGCGPLEALTKSGQLTYGHKWKIFSFILIGWLITVLSIITIIGPVILFYIFVLSRTYIYRTLQKIQEGSRRSASDTLVPE